MLEIKPQGKIVEKIVRAKTGEFVVATFFVSEINGELQIRLLRVVPLRDSEKTANLQLETGNYSLCLFGTCAKSPAVTAERHIYTEIVSPFFNALEFFVSQPTRAPSGSF